MRKCKFEDCGALANITVQIHLVTVGEAPINIDLCDAHIADWGMRWRDDHSELIEEIEF